MAFSIVSRYLKRPLRLFICMLLTTLLPLGFQAKAREVTDDLGRRVIIPDRPKRVVSLAPSITEIIFSIHREASLVGVTQFSDFPPEAKSLPSVGSYVNLDLERIVALNPDLCLATKDGNPREIIKRLASLNIPVYVLDPRDLEAVMDSLLKIGDLLDAHREAAVIVEKMRDRIRRVTSRIATAAHRPTVFFQIGITPIISVGTSTYIDKLIRLAGGENVAEGPTAYPQFSEEQVVALAPEVLIITSMARGGRFEQVKRRWEKWAHLPAVKNDRILVVDSNLFDRPSPRIVDALETLAAKIHPEVFVETP
ncbi:MAG: cobalamin-binding protein [Deltaproteobacteria bacterium]